MIGVGDDGDGDAASCLASASCSTLPEDDQVLPLAVAAGADHNLTMHSVSEAWSTSWR